MKADLPFTSVNLRSAQSTAAAATAVVVPGTELSKRVLYKSIVGEDALLQQNGCTKKVTQCGCFVLDHVCRRGYNLENFCTKAQNSTCISASNTQAESCECKNDEWNKHNLVSSIEWYRIHLNARSEVLSGLSAFAQSIHAQVEKKPLMIVPSLYDLQHYESDLSHEEEQEEERLERQGENEVTEKKTQSHEQNASHLSSLNDPTSNDYIYVPSTILLREQSEQENGLLEEQPSVQKNTLLTTQGLTEETEIQSMECTHKDKYTSTLSNTITNSATQELASTSLPTKLRSVKIEDCCASNSCDTQNNFDENSYSHVNCTFSDVPQVAAVNTKTPLIQVKLEKEEKECALTIAKDEAASHADMAPSAPGQIEMCFMESSNATNATQFNSNGIAVSTTNDAITASLPVPAAPATYTAPVQTSRFVGPPTYTKPIETNSRFVLPPTTSINLPFPNAESKNDNTSTSENENIVSGPSTTTVIKDTHVDASPNGSTGNDSNVQESIPFLSTNFLTNIAVEAKERRNNPRVPLHAMHSNTLAKYNSKNNTININSYSNVTLAKNECSTTYLTPTTFTTAPLQSPTQELPSQIMSHSIKNECSSHHSRHKSRSLSSHSHHNHHHHRHDHHHRHHRHRSSSSLESSRNAAREFASEFSCLSSASSHSHSHTRKRSRETSAEYPSHHREQYRHSNDNKEEEYVPNEADRRSITANPPSLSPSTNAVSNTQSKSVMRLDAPQSIIRRFKNCLILCKACRVMFPAGAHKLRSHVCGSFHINSVNRVKELWQEMKKKELNEVNPDNSNNNKNVDVDTSKSIAVNMENRSLNDMINELPAGALYKCVRTEHHGSLCDLSRVYAVIGCISASEERTIHNQKNSFCDDGFDLVVTSCKVCNTEINPGAIENHLLSSEHHRKAKSQKPSTEPEKKTPPKKKERKNLYRKLEIIRKLLK